MSNPTILVVGDVMTDRYFIGTSTRTSAEVEGLPIVKVSEVLEFDGGAGNVANNLRDLGANSMLVATGGFPIKNRVILDGRQVARFDEQDYCNPTSDEYIASICGKLRLDGIVVSDYLKGSITQQLRYRLLTIAAYQSVPMFINTKGDPSEWYHSAVDTTFVCNRHEYTLWSDAYRRASQVIITQGADGVVRQSPRFKDYPYCHFQEQLPAFTNPSDVVCVNGAGDTFLSAYAYASLTNTPNPLEFANAASAVVVRKPFTATATPLEVEEMLYTRYYNEALTS